MAAYIVHVEEDGSEDRESVANIIGRACDAAGVPVIGVEPWQSPNDGQTLPPPPDLFGGLG